MRGKGQIGTITHSIRTRAPLLHRLWGTPAKLFISPTKVFFSLAGVRDEDVRVGSHTHEDIRVKAKKKRLVHARATRSRVARSLLLTCLSRLYDAHPTLGSGIGRYRAPTHLIRRRARPTSPIGDDSHVRVLARCLFLYMHKYARAEGGSTCV